MAVFGFKFLLPNQAELGIWAGLLLIFEWHLVWAAGSGMETILSAIIALAVLMWVILLEQQYIDGKYAGWWQWLCLGFLIGVSVWIRPDGITLLGVIGSIPTKIAFPRFNWNMSTKRNWLGISCGSSELNRNYKIITVCNRYRII